MIDLRSDTVTRPTPGMLEAMFRAEVGDDVLRDDPTVNRLEQMSAEFLGHEAALFTASGTMANQIALRTWARPGEEVILDRWSHSYIYEVGAAAALSGLSIWPVDTPSGLLTPEDVVASIRADNIHLPETRVVAVENTHNRHGGVYYPVEQFQALREMTQSRGLKLHCDGARLANAAVAAGVSMADYGRRCDSVTLCLSKGLGCPVGSMLAGPVEFIDRARKCRKMLGGGMRQAGYLAAAGVYALEHHVDRLARDHANARRLAESLAAMDEIDIDLGRVVTNIVYVRFKRGPERARQVTEAVNREGLLCLLLKEDTVRLVTHLDVSDDGVSEAIKTLKRHLAES